MESTMNIQHKLIQDTRLRLEAFGSFRRFHTFIKAHNNGGSPPIITMLPTRASIYENLTEMLDIC
jgi:hypothetical protein